MAAATQTIYRTCPTCEASCGLVLEVDRDQRKVISVKGDPADERSRGYVCAKSQAFRYIYEDPERVRRPLKKTPQGWQEISWQQALTEVGDKLKALRDAHGKDAIAMYYGNPNGHNFHTQLYTELFINMLGTERFFSAGSVDQQPKNLVCELLYGNPWLFPVPDMDRSDFFVCMGGNPVVSQGSILGAPNAAGKLKDIRARGGKVVVIDPRRSETAEVADQHLFIRPGTDALFLFAWINELFATHSVKPGHLAAFTDGVDEVRALAQPFTPEATAAITGISAEQLRALVRDFNRASAPVLYGRIGLCTQEFGTLASWLVEVVNILSGRQDVEGGAMFGRPATGNNEPTGQVNELKHSRWFSRARGFPEYMSMLPASLMAEEMECTGADQVRALITVAGNPVLSVPNGKRIRDAMQKLDLVVALDIYVNETTSQADYILPSIVQLEHSNYEFLFSAFAQRNFVHYSPQVFEPETDTRAQFELFLEIAARLHGMNAGDLDAMMLEGLIGHVLAAPQLSHLSADMIKAKTAQFAGAERMLDILLRVGPYGDGFADGGTGLSLEKVKAAQHGMDLGPLQSQLPRILRTEGQRIRLTHPLLSNDIPRLQATLQRKPAELVMIGRRHIRDMNSWLHNITPYVRGDNRCTLLINPTDAKRYGLADGGRAELRSRTGAQTVEISISDSIMPGVVSLPHGFGHRHRETQQTVARERMPGVSANDIVDDEVLDLPSGTSVVNGVPVTLVAVSD
jgi:anaerobic selenocysteine-containing dehydrogenase